MNLPPAIFDRKLLRSRKKRAQAELGEHDFLFCEAAARLVDRLDDVTRRFEHVLELGCQGPWLAQALSEKNIAPRCAGPMELPGVQVVADDEALPFAPQSADLILSLMSLHWVNDLPGALVQIARTLKPDGLFLAMMPGGETLKELREAFDAAMIEEGGISPRVSPFVDVRDAGSLLQRAGFALPVVDSDRITVTYGDVFELLFDLRGAGETNMLAQRSRTPLPRRTLSRMADLYQARFSDGEGRVRATIELVTLTAWKPDASQQQPARRGSGQVSLTEVLGKH